MINMIKIQCVSLLNPACFFIEGHINIFITRVERVVNLNRSVSISD